MRPLQPASGAPQAPAHVVQVVQSIDRGGLEMMSVDLAIALRARGLESTVLGLTEGGRLEARLANAGVRFELIGGARYWSANTQLAMMRTLTRLRPTVVHTHHLPSLLTAGVAARLVGVQRVVHTEHAHQYLEGGPGVQRRLRWAARTADSVVLVGEALRPYYVDTVALSSRRVHVIPNGIDTDRFRPLAPEEVRARRASAGLPVNSMLVGAVGRLAPVKNYGLLLRAAALAREGGVGVSVALVGDGEERESLEQLARELDLGTAVTFLGWRSDVAALVGAFDVLAITSTSEALPLVVLEAMSAGVAVVSTAVGEIPRVLGDSRAGLLAPSNDVAAFADALVRLTRDEGMRAGLGRHGRERVCEEYSHTTMVERYLALYGVGPTAGA